jgi:hypothetical protein
MIRKDQQKRQVVHLTLFTTAAWLELISNSFVQDGSLAPPQPSSAKQNLETCAINAGCSDTGQKTAKNQDTVSQTPGESLHIGNSDVIQVQQLDNYESYFEFESGSRKINLKKNRLKTSLSFWKNINTSECIIDIIESGNKSPFVNEPENIILKNNKSALDHTELVEKAIKELSDANLIREESSRPHVVNPLTLSISSGKGRLILDLGHVNKQVRLAKCKFED